MSTDRAQPKVECCPAEVDEAAVWIARLHGPERSVQLERGFRRWLAASPAHAAAFEKISEAWELGGALPKGPFPHLSRWERAGFRAGFARSAAVVGALAVVTVLGALLYVRVAGVATGIGEQRVLALPDGSRVTLNTASRVRVDFTERERRIELKSGEALFEVARKAHNVPFVVVAGDRTVTALGTAFIVRKDPRRISVTLVEGRVAVATAMGEPAATEKAITTLSPGQRLTFVENLPPRLDRPSVEKVTAWRRGQVDLEDMPLADAAAEMNRYSAVRLVIERPEAAAIPINGVFRAGDTASFAAAIARAYELEVIERGDEIVLAGAPRVPPQMDDLRSR